MATNQQVTATDAADGRGFLVRLRAAVPALRRWFVGSRRRLVMLAAAALLFLLGSVGLWLSLTTARLGLQSVPTLAEALDALDRGACVEARSLVEAMLKTGTVAPEDLGGPAFVLGMVTFRETAEGWVSGKTSPFLLAARHLEESRDRGFPAGRRGEGLFFLGKSLLLAGRYTDCREPLAEAIAAGYGNKKELDRLLTAAFLLDANPKTEDALRHNSAYLAAPDLTGSERTEALLERCRILFGLGRAQECRQVLGEIPADIQDRGDVIVLRGQLLLAEARAAAGGAAPAAAGSPSGEVAAKYREAIEVLRQAQAHDTLDRQATRTSMYLIGLCMTEMGDSFRSQAIEQLARTRKLYFDSADGLAATLLEADMLRAGDRAKEAVAAYRLALSAAGNPLEYSNTWVPLDEFRARVVAAFEDFSESGQFAHAEEMLGGFRPMFPQLRTLELVARTAQRWGDAMVRSAEHLPESQAQPLRQRARERFRHAGYTHLQLAQARVASRHYPDDLWNSAQNLLKGHDFKTAREILKKHLAEQSPQWRAAALVGLGQANLALGHIDESLAVLRECIDFHPRDPATYTARLWCSKAYLEKGKHAEAEALLRENLTSDSLTPASSEWRDALFALGELLILAERYEDAVESLDEAVARYPDTPHATWGAYMIATAYREAAKKPQKRLREAAAQTVRVASRRQVQKLLNEAFDYYQKVQKLLLDRAETWELTAMDAAMLRNCFLAIGSILFDLERYEEAIEVYANAATRYQDEPVVLETFLQIAHCYRRQGKPIEARGAVEQAKVILKQLPAKEDFTTTTNYTRDEWITLLGQLST